MIVQSAPEFSKVLVVAKAHLGPGEGLHLRGHCAHDGQTGARGSWCPTVGVTSGLGAEAHARRHSGEWFSCRAAPSSSVTSPRGMVMATRC